MASDSHYIDSVLTFTKCAILVKLLTSVHVYFLICNKERLSFSNVLIRIRGNFCKVPSTGWSTQQTLSSYILVFILIYNNKK